MISEDLTLHRRTLEPLKTLIYGLRRYDTDRAAAMAESLGEAARPGDSSGYLTHKSKIYLVRATLFSDPLRSEQNFLGGCPRPRRVHLG